jgi:hypothetical protein
MTDQDKQQLKIGEVVRTDSGKYLVAAIDADGTPILARCFRMGNPAKYQPGFPPAFLHRSKK